MAQNKKSQAEQAAARSKSNKEKNPEKTGTGKGVKTGDRKIPVRVISSIVIASAFLFCGSDRTPELFWRVRSSAYCSAV